MSGSAILIGILLAILAAACGVAWWVWQELAEVEMSMHGYIALAAVIMGKWRPAAAALACLFFGLAEALQLNLQASGGGVPRELVQMLPYVLTIVALAGFIGRSPAPGALGRPR